MNMKRMRGRTHRHGGGGGGGPPPYRQGGGGGQPMNRNHIFDSSGPDVRMRGTSQQLFEKYLQMGRDATGGGDRVMAESYFQHAEHYFRILNAMNQAQQQPPGGQAQAPRRYHNGPELAGEMGEDQPEMPLQVQQQGHQAHQNNGHAPDQDQDEQQQGPDPRDRS
jgi:hypothetical protein